MTKLAYCDENNRLTGSKVAILWSVSHPEGDVGHFEGRIARMALADRERDSEHGTGRVQTQTQI